MNNLRSLTYCWKLCDTLIFSNVMNIHTWFRFSRHNQRSIYAVRVLSPIYGTVPCVYNRTLSVCFFRICREFWGVNRSVVVKSLNQVNKSWVNKEARYSVFAFSTIWKIYFFSLHVNTIGPLHLLWAASLSSLLSINWFLAQTCLGGQGI